MVRIDALSVHYLLKVAWIIFTSPDWAARKLITPRDTEKNRLLISLPTQFNAYSELQIRLCIFNCSIEQNNFIIYFLQSNYIINLLALGKKLEFRYFSS